jgi:uncharacterized protein (TIGR02145 family)
VSLISENLEWQTANDPCALLLGDGWRVPTATEWINVDAAGNWVDPQGPWTSGLKMHQAGRLSSGTGSLQNRGNNGTYWGSTQMVGQTGMAEFMSFLGTVCQMANSAKAMGASVRCVKD